MNLTIVDSVIMLAACAVTTVVFVQLFKTVLNSILVGKFDVKTLFADGDFPSSHTSILVSFNIVLWHIIYVYHLSHPECDMFGSVVAALVLGLWSCYEIRDAMGVRLRVQEHAQAIKLIAEKSKDLSDIVENLKLGDDDINTQALEKELDDLLRNLKLKAGHLPHEVLGGIVTGGLIAGMFISVMDSNFVQLAFVATVFLAYVLSTVLIFVRNRIKRGGKL